MAIKSNETYSVNSVNINNNYLVLDGALDTSNYVELSPPGMGISGGEISIASGSLNAGSINNGSAIEGYGSINVSSALNNQGVISGGGLSIAAGSLTNTGSLSAIVGSSGAGLTVTVRAGGFTNLSGTTLTGGDYDASSDATLDLNVGARIVTDAASIVLAMSGVYQTAAINSFDPILGRYVSLQTSLQNISASGSLQLDGLAYATTNTLTVAGALTLSGLASLSTGELNLMAGGTVTGVGTIAGPIVNNGTITGTIISQYANSSGENAAGTLTLQGPVSGSSVLDIGRGAASQVYGRPETGLSYVIVSATLELGSAASGLVQFTDGTGILQLDDPGAFTGTIAPAPTITTFSFYGGEFSNSQVILSGVPKSSVTGYSYTGDANGGTLTIQEGGSQQNLNFAGNFSTSSFTLSSAATSVPSLDVTVTSIPTAPTIALSTPNGTASKQIINFGNPTIVGVNSAGSAVALSANGMAEGTALDTSTFGTTSSSYSQTLSPALTAGAQQLVAVASNSAGSQSSAPLNLFVLPSPINGVTAANVSSIDLATLVGQGYGMQFISGTEAIQLTNGTLSIGPDTNQAFVQRMYEGLLNRSGDPQGVGFLSARLSQGATQTDVAHTLLNVPEFTADHGAQGSLSDGQYVTLLAQGFLARIMHRG